MPSKGRTRIGAVVVFTLVSIYLVKLSGLALETHRAGQAREAMRQEVGQLEREVLALETAATEAGSEAYVEQWAREKRNMARPGDRVVAPIAAEPDAAEPAPPAAEPQAPRSGWQRFVDWLRGEPAPASDED